MPTFRNQVRVKRKLNVPEWFNQLEGLARSKIGLKVKDPVRLSYLDPRNYTVRSHLDNKFMTVAKKLIFINQPINLLHMLQLLTLTCLSQEFSLLKDNFREIHTAVWILSIHSALQCGVFTVCIFPHLEWIRRNAEFLSEFSPNVGKYTSEKLWTQPLLTCL